MEEIKVVLLEDNPDDVELLLFQLENEAFEVRATHVQTLEGYRQAIQAEPDIILSDYHIPQFGAPEALALLQETGLDIPFIIVSGAVGEEEAVTAIKQGADDYLLKDRLTRLGSAIRQALEKRSLRQARLAAEQKIKRQEAYYRLLIESVLDVVTVLDETLSIVYASPSVERVLGYPPEAVLGQPVQSFFHPEDQRIYLRALRQAVPAKGVVGATTLRFRHRNGSWRMLEVIGQTIESEEGQPRFLFNGRDVTAREQARVELIQAKERAEEMVRLKDAFLANMSHEIRTPLTAIIGYGQMLEEELRKRENATLEQEFAQNITGGGERLLATLNSVLDLSMLQAGSLTLTPEQVDVEREVQKAVNLLQSLAQQKGIRLYTQAPTRPALARLDRAALGRILHNLIGNALKFTEAGEVSVEVAAQGAEVSVVVRDTGIGIDPVFLPKLFESFTQESDGLARRFEGTGLGLAIVKQLVEVLGGQITVESQKGEGSVFRVVFPREVAAAPGPPAQTPAATPRPTAEAAAPSAWARVLVVEDNDSMRRLAQRLVAQLPEVATVEAAADDEEALAWVHQADFHLILMDINLGTARSGEDVFREVRLLPGYAKVPVVALTAYALPGDEQHFLDTGFDAYMSKPFNPKEIQRLVQSMLRQKYAGAVLE